MRSTLILILLIVAFARPGLAHDIPNARVDRSIQVTVEPERLRIDYQVGLSELTLTQDLRQVIGELPGADRRGWFEQYGKVTGPLNAKGVLVTANGEDVELSAIGFDLLIEGHPLFTFHFEAKIPPRGHLTVNDTNYLASEGTSRLAIRGGNGVQVQGDQLPTEVTQIPIRPLWQLEKLEERRTRRVLVDYALATPVEPVAKIPQITQHANSTRLNDSLSRLLDTDANQTWPMLGLLALILGGAHAIQPGHGKLLVIGSSLGSGFRPIRGALLGLATATVHMASVALIAALLWTTRAIRPEHVHLTLARSTGFLIAAIGLWKLGRHLGAHGEHDTKDALHSSASQGILPIALAGGAVPCWDAVALVLVAEAIGRLSLGLWLLGAFSLGMAGVLVLVGASASRFRSLFDRSQRQDLWERGLGLLGGVVLSGLGLALLFRS